MGFNSGFKGLRQTYMLDFLASPLEENNSYLFEPAHCRRHFT